MSNFNSIQPHKLIPEALDILFEPRPSLLHDINHRLNSTGWTIFVLSAVAFSPERSAWPTKIRRRRGLIEDTITTEP